LPVIEFQSDVQSSLGRAGIEKPGADAQLDLQPVEGLPAELRFRPIALRRLILASSGSGQRRRAGGVVSVLGLAVVAEPRVNFQRQSPKDGRRRRIPSGRRRLGRRLGVRRCLRAPPPFATSAHNWVNAFCSSAGSLASAVLSRIPAKSVSSCQ